MVGDSQKVVSEGVSLDMQDRILINLIINFWLLRCKRVYVELRNMRL